MFAYQQTFSMYMTSPLPSHLQLESALAADMTGKKLTSRGSAGVALLLSFQDDHYKSGLLVLPLQRMLHKLNFLFFPCVDKLHTDVENEDG